MADDTWKIANVSDYKSPTAAGHNRLIGRAKANGRASGRLSKGSDEFLALQFAEEHAEDLRFVAIWGQWFVWREGRWQRDDTLLALDYARSICRAASVACSAKSIASAKTIAAVERLAKADRRLAATADQWDQNIWWLNTPAGTIDLRTGKMRTHRREDHMTKSTRFTPGGECPLWLAFLGRITDGNAALVNFLQRVAGYCLTGSIEEHALFFGHGKGANGKSVFISTISGAMGDYSKVAPMEQFIVSTHDHHPTGLAALRGARLVTAQETEEGRRWAESKIKALTGGDRISARFMRQDFFEFLPQFKLVIIGNHRPGLRAVDEAIRRRMILIPFSITIPAEDRDEKLSERLLAEGPGILQWMIDGCVKWQEEGLAQPEAVRKATDDYLDGEDLQAQWLAERCVEQKGCYTTAADLFESWQKWAEVAREVPGSKKRFSQMLQARGFVAKRQARSGSRGFADIRLKGPSDEYDEREAQG